MKDDISYSRLGYHGAYIDNAVTFYKEYKELEQEYLKSKLVLKDSDHPEIMKYMVIVKQAQRLYLSSFLFFSLFLEAYIYDYAARRLGDQYAFKYLDRLDFISKWVTIPRLITGQQIDTARQSFATIKDMVAFRNKIIHHKSQDTTYERVKNYKPIDEQIKIDDIIVAIIDIFNQLEAMENKNDPHKFYISVLMR